MGRFGQNGAPLPRSNLVSGHGNGGGTDLEQLAVAAVDESYSNIRPNLTYMVVVCSVPKSGGREKLPRPETALNAPSDYGLVVVGMVLPPWGNGYDRTGLWVRGVWQGLNYANDELQRQGHLPVEVAFVDGEEPGDFRRAGAPISQVEVKFASKHGTRHYEPSVDPFAVMLLRLADGVAKLVRRKTDERGNLEVIMSQLAQLQEPLLAYAPAQLRHSGISGNGHVTT